MCLLVKFTNELVQLSDDLFLHAPPPEGKVLLYQTADWFALPGPQQVRSSRVKGLTPPAPFPTHSPVLHIHSRSMLKNVLFTTPQLALFDLD